MGLLARQEQLRIIYISTSIDTNENVFFESSERVAH